MKITTASHLDHALSDAHLTWLLAEFGERDGFIIETVSIPAHLSPVSCRLHGPAMGDPPVPDSECRQVVRGNRAGASRMCDRPARETHTLTVIAGKLDDEPCVLYTAFGGPLAPREPWDPQLDARARVESEVFWSQHALTEERKTP